MTTLEVVPSNLLKLIKRRDAQKKTITTIQSYVNKFDPSSMSLTQLQTRLEKLAQAMSTYNVIQSKIEDHNSSTTPMLNDRTEVEDLNCTLRAQILDLMEGNNKDSVNTTATYTLSCDSMKRNFVEPVQMFDGNLQNWFSFRHSFDKAFHNNQGLTDYLRMYYLKYCLSGSAAEFIKTIPNPDDNYHAVYSALIAKYEIKSLIIQSHIRSLFQSPKVSKPVAADLRRLHHHIISHIGALNALGQSVQNWDAWLVTLVCSRLDPTTVREWRLRQTSRDLPSFAAIEKFLSDLVAAYEVGEVGRTAGNHNSHHNNSRRKCRLCKGDHSVSYCKRFNNQSFSNRMAIVFIYRLCYNCLNPGHQVPMCESSGCFKCSRLHHTKLHNDSWIATSELMPVQLPM